jgi:uncharacterized membrane protein
MDTILDQPQQPINERRSIEDVLQNGYSISIGDVWNRGSEIWKKNIGGFLLYLIIGYIAIMIVGIIPILGTFVTSLILSPAFAGGFFIAAYAITKNGSVSANDYTLGFRKMADNALFVLMSFFIMILIFTPVILSVIGSIALLIKADYKTPSGIQEVITLLAPVFGIMAVCLVIAILAYILFMLAYPLIHVYGLSAWEAITTSARTVLKQYLTFILLALTLLLLNIGGVLCLGIGLLFTIPLSYCIIYAAYESIFEGTAKSFE